MLVGGPKPTVATLPPLTDGGAPRPVARLGNGDFVANELIVQTASRSALDGLLHRWNGTILKESGPTVGTKVYLVRIDPSKASPAGLAADLRALDPLARGTHRVSSATGLDLVSAAADEESRGLTIGINWIPRAESYSDRKIKDGFSKMGGFDTNAFNLSYMKDGGPMDIGVAEAWRRLAGAGKLDNKVKIAVIDGGFTKSDDFDPSWPGQNNHANGVHCSGDKACFWHGTETAATAGAIPDNGFGVAGSGGPVADLVMIQNGDGTEFDLIDGIYEAFDAKAKIISISAGYEIDALVSWAQVPIEDATQSAAERGILVFAAAGNENRDVDAEDCVIACWEEEWFAPCENQGVICVGALTDSTQSRASYSNWGEEWCEEALCDVQIFGPGSVFVPPDPTKTDIHWGNGTSVATPFVAGVAALIWAASPSLSAHDVELTLLNYAHLRNKNQVSLVVGALASVSHLIANDPPVPEIVEAPIVGSYGKLNLMTFRAKAADDDGPAGCCTYTWSSDKDGPLGSGAELQYAFGSPGERVITVTATDAKGAKGSTSVEFKAVNTAPQVTLGFPKAGDQLYRNVPYTLSASVADNNEDIPCDNITWKFTGPGSVTTTGCNPTVTLQQLGSWQLLIEAVDSPGMASTYSLNLNVVTAPANKPPIVAISAPITNLVLDANAFKSLVGSAVDPDGTATPTYKWTVQRKSGGPVTQIGTTATLSWRPRDTFGSSCSNLTVTLTLSATDPDGTGTASVDVTLGYPPC